jgi:antirestriction protein ArdC
VNDFKRDLDQALFGGPEPSWEDIRQDARRLLRATRVEGGEQAFYDKAMDNLIKPTVGEFTDDAVLLEEAMQRDQKRLSEADE